MNTLDNARDYEKELTRIFNRFNHHFWNDELPEVIITFTGTKGAHGHMTTEPVWIAEGSDSKYELNISAFTINRDPEEICGTLLHEQCHLYCNINKIDDCSNHGRYHNGNFKKVDESHHLIVKQDGYHGWSHTELDTEAKAYVKKLNIKKLEYHREMAPKKGGNLTRYICPDCEGTIVYVSSPQYVICGLCGSTLVPLPARGNKKAP